LGGQGGQGWPGWLARHAPSEKKRVVCQGKCEADRARRVKASACMQKAGPRRVKTSPMALQTGRQRLTGEPKPGYEKRASRG
jgi:hypothetical protein